MSELITSPLFPVEGLSPQTLVKLPPKPNAQSGSIKLYIIYAEPHIFVEGFTDTEVNSRPPAVLRGCLFLRVLKPIKAKTISLKLKGHTRTDWPEGIPPAKHEHVENKTVLSHTWPFFNYLNTYPVLDHSRNNADLYVPKSDQPDLEELANFSLDSATNNNLSPQSSQTSLSDIYSLKSPSSLVNALMGSSHYSSSNANLKDKDPAADNASEASESIKVRPTTSRSGSLLGSLSGSGTNGNVDDNKLFPPGDYIYSFEQLFPANLPETMSLTFGSVHYVLEAQVERAGAFKTNLYARRSVNVVRTPCNESSEENEPIVINRDWENQLHYEIVISSKQIILNSFVPMSFKLAPLDKIKVHRIRIYVTEHLEYYCHHKRVHRAEPAKKVLLLEHTPPEGSDNLLEQGGGNEISGVNLDFQLYMPEFYGDRYRLHPDTYCEDIQSHHWIKICVRLSKLDPTIDDPLKRKHYELSIDSPIHLLSRHCAHANTLLPSYTEQMQEDEAGTLDQPRNLVDMNMTPREDMIRDANLYSPDSTIPIELLSPQAKPFSPMVSPALNAIHPGLRESDHVKPLDLLKTLSTVATPPGPVRSNSLTPPPPFEEVDKHPPPTYEEAVQKEDEEGEDVDDPESPPAEVGNRGRSATCDTMDDSTDLGDIGGNFRLKVMPIRSRSQSPNQSPAASPRLGPTMGRPSSPTLQLAQAIRSRAASNIDSALLDGLVDDESDPHSSTSPSPSAPTSPAQPAVSSPRSDSTVTQGDASVVPDASSEAMSVPLSDGADHSAGPTVAGSVSSTNSLSHSFGSLRKPLLSSEDATTMFGASVGNLSNISLRNGSITTNLSFARDPESSIDITNMLGSTISRPDTPVHPVGLASNMPGSPPSTDWRSFAFTGTHGDNSNGKTHKHQERRSLESAEEVDFGASPILSAVPQGPVPPIEDL